uniref:D-xylose transport system ATP-binding protein/taurine transport system ATP-binding protein n=1 Tax=Candidatus Kentrum sp. FW TaxID=2126338 RepID=A0A450SUC4_9GAMM|nr:MAG: D-xylose transport system ATP-binding protein/taurine transport system ATP-binding protein [Candidatus Kentron sp. FW]
MDLISPAMTKHFPARSAGEDFTLSLPEIRYRVGELVFLMGHNGSGKSVYGRLLSGEWNANEGAAHIRWSEKGTQVAPGMGIVMQQVDQNLALDLTILENLVLRIPRHGWAILYKPSTQHRYRAEASLSNHPELFRKRHHQVSTLSLGQRQTLAFLCARFQSSDILLLDEFLASTDRATSQSLLVMVREFVAETGTAIIISHDLAMALEEADRILVLQRGLLVGDIQRGQDSWALKSLENLISL